MGAWFEPPGGAAASLSDSDLILVSQNGVSRTVTRSQLIRGALEGYVFTDAGGTDKLCQARAIFLGVDDVGADIWGWQLTTLAG